MAIAISITDDGYLVDGRHRLLACYTTGKDPRFKTIGDIDPLIVVLSSETRRHLNASQRAIMAARVRSVFDERAKERQREAGAKHTGNQYTKKDKMEVVAQVAQAAKESEAENKARNQAAKVRSVFDERAKARQVQAGKDYGKGAKPKVVPPVAQAKSEPETKSRDAAAKAVGSNGKYTDLATDILKYGSKQLVQQVERGEVNIKQAHKQVEPIKREAKQAAQPVTVEEMTPVITVDGKTKMVRFRGNFSSTFPNRCKLDYLRRQRSRFKI